MYIAAFVLAILSAIGEAAYVISCLNAFLMGDSDVYRATALIWMVVGLIVLIIGIIGCVRIGQAIKRRTVLMTGEKILILLFVNLISGILLLCDKGPRKLQPSVYLRQGYTLPNGDEIKTPNTPEEAAFARVIANYPTTFGPTARLWASGFEVARSNAPMSYVETMFGRPKRIEKKNGLKASYWVMSDGLGSALLTVVFLSDEKDEVVQKWAFGGSAPFDFDPFPKEEEGSDSSKTQ